MRECWNRQTGRLEVPVSNHRRVGSSPISRTKKDISFELMSFFSLLVDNGTEPVDQKDRNGHFNQIRKYKREHACGESSQ